MLELVICGRKRWTFTDNLFYNKLSAKKRSILCRKLRAYELRNRALDTSNLESGQESSRQRKPPSRFDDAQFSSDGMSFFYC